jgi:hypothetical protein
MPCGDRQEGNGQAEKKNSAVINLQEQQHPTKECTPFCSCICCAATVFYQPVPYFNAGKVVFQSAKFPIYNSSSCSEVSFTIWQPPKMG